MPSFRLIVVLLALSTELLAQGLGSINGRVVDSGGRPIAGAQIELRPASRRTVSDEEGRFALRNLAAGTYELGVRRIGYRASSVSVDVAMSEVRPTIVLTAIPSVLDSVVIRERAARMRYAAVVVDEADRPIADVAVIIPGVDNKLRTDSAGRFIVPRPVHGTIMVRMRKIGYAAFFGTYRMLTERDDTLRMTHLATTLSAALVLEGSGFGRDTFAYRDLDQRMRWRTTKSVVISRDELDVMGRTPLCTALSFTPSGARGGARCNAAMCVVLDGERTTLMPPTAFYSDEVESVEYYPPKSDGSGTLRSRGCDERGSVFVIWRRKPLTGSP